MNFRKKKSKVKFILVPFLSIFFVFIVLNFFIHYYRTLRFNNTERITRANSENAFMELQFYPRGGNSDSWVKTITTKNEKTSLNAKIYEGKIINKYDIPVQNWSLRININQDCYINNGWCGTVEIHQVTTYGEKVQTLDLREMSKEKISLDYLLLDQEILIPLSKGDYIIYHPNPTTETWIDRNYAYILIGLIFYFEGDSFDSSDFEIKSFLKKNIMTGKPFYATVTVSIIWTLMFLALVIYEIFTAHTRKMLRRKDMLIEEALSVFSNFVDAKDTYTNGHSARVAEYSMKIAERLNFSESECRNIYNIALLHDCGKCYIPDSVLKKRGRLTEEEYQIIKKHTEYGAKILENFKSFPDVFCGALYHHERYDGKGYPTGKKGEDIPLIGRIICVADSFDAMNSSRCYREPLSMEKIISEIEKGKGTQFDPTIADIFLEILKSERKKKKSNIKEISKN